MGLFWLEFEQGGRVEQVSFDTSSVAIGRGRECDFVLDHPTVSRQHARIVHRGRESFALVILSEGGLTAIDARPARQSEVKLYDGTRITLGKHTVTFRSTMAPRKPAGAGVEAAGGGDLHGAHTTASAPDYNDTGFGGGVGMRTTGKTSGSDKASGTDEFGVEKDNARDKGKSIMSWDEIAASSDENDDVEPGPGANSRRLQRGGDQDEESNPIIVFGALGVAVVMLVFAVFAGGGGSEEGSDSGSSFDDMPPIEVSVSCLDEVDCRDRAREAYEQGLDLLERRSVERSNLFRGYEQLVKAESYLTEGGVDEIPSDLEQWQEKHDEARESLDKQFAEYRMRFHQAQTRQRYTDMAEVLEEVESFFPEREARENWWARQHERRMKSEGTYPTR